MLYWMCAKTKLPPTGPQLEHAIKRNFGGLEDENLKPDEIFMNHIQNIRDTPNLAGKEGVYIILVSSNS